MWVNLVVLLLSCLILVQASNKCDTFPLCNADELAVDVSNVVELEDVKNCTDCEETSIESPLIVSTTEIPIKPPEPSAFRNVHLFDLDIHETTSDEQPDVSQSTFDSTETTKSSDFFKINDELILRDLLEIEGKQRIEVEPRRTTPPSIMSTLVFPPLPRGDLYRVHTLDLEDGFFPFSFISTLVSLIQSAAYPLDLVRSALLQRISLPELVTQSISQEPGTIATLTLGAMLGVGTPLILLILCCVSLVRKCRDKDKVEEDCGSDTDSSGGGNCKRGGLVFAMLLVLSLLAAGIAGILSANEQVGSGTVRAPVVLDTALGDAATFVRNSHQQLRFVVTSAIDQAVEATNADLDNIESLLGSPVQREIAAETGIDVALDVLSDISMAAQSMSEKCVALHQSAATARQLARSTQERLAELRAQVDTFRRQCPGRDRPLCETLDTTGLEVAVSLDHIISDTRLAQLRKLRNESLTSLAQQARAEFQFVPHQFEADTREARIGLRRSLEARRTELYEAMKPLDELARHMELRVQRARDVTSRALQPLPDVEQWRWLVALCAGVSVLLIWVIFVSAIGCGCCGAERQANCALVTSLVFLGLLSTALWVVALAAFVLGGRTELLVCHPLRAEPDFTALSALFDKSPALYGGTKPGLLANLAYSNETLDVPLRDILAECRDNRPTYTTFKLYRLFDAVRASEHRSWSIYHDELKRLRVDLRQLQLLSPELSRRLSMLLEASSVDLAAHRAQLSGHVTSRDLKSFAAQMEGVAGQIRDQTTSTRLESLVARTRRLLANNVQPLEKQKDELVYQMTSLEVQLAPLQRQANQSLSHLKTIQYYISNEGSIIAQQKSGLYAARLLNYAQQFQDYVLESIRGPVAQCRPLWNAFQSVRQVTCDHITDPLNGIWLSLMWSLVMLLIAIPIAMALLGQYNRVSKSSLLNRTTESQDSPPSNGWSNTDNQEESGRW